MRVCIVVGYLIVIAADCMSLAPDLCLVGMLLIAAVAVRTSCTTIFFSGVASYLVRGGECVLDLVFRHSVQQTLPPGIVLH